MTMRRYISFRRFFALIGLLIAFVLLLDACDNTGVGSVDSSHNGLWKVNTDGTGLTRLTGEAANEDFGFPFTRTPWSVVSRDGGNYAVLRYTFSLATPGTITPLVSTTLLTGSINGGPSVAFASLTRTSGTIDTIDLVGWTTM